MIWDLKMLARLMDIVEGKFDELEEELIRKEDGPRRKILDVWKEYLNEQGIERVPWRFNKKRSGEARYVWIECPWSVRHSTPGVVQSKSELYFPWDTAEKIVVLGSMP